MGHATATVSSNSTPIKWNFNESFGDCFRKKQSNKLNSSLTSSFPRGVLAALAARRDPTLLLDAKKIKEYSSGGRGRGRVDNGENKEFLIL